MHTETSLAAYETVSSARDLTERLSYALAELSGKPGLTDEKGWLTTGIDRLNAAYAEVGDLLSRVMLLPELESVREDHLRSLQQEAVDSIERLQGGIMFHFGARAPIVETLFGRLKMPLIRRCESADFEKFCSDFEKRLASGYVTRMFGEPSFDLIRPALDALYASFGAWRAGLAGGTLAESMAQHLRDELDACARRLELPSRQARLLAEAALCPIRGAFDASGIGQRSKRRPVRNATVDVEASEEHEALN